MQRRANFDPRALSRLGSDGERAVHQPDPLFHADQPQTAFASAFLEIEPMAYIFNYEDNLAIASGQIDAHLFRLCVFADVPQAFLGNTVQAQREVSG
jgi:hypothetical protein